MDETAGVWYYVSSTLKVCITRHKWTSGLAHVWFEAEVTRKAGSADHLHCYDPDTTSTKAYRGSTLAEGKVLAINADYYLRRRNKGNTGLIIRNGELLYKNTVSNTKIRSIPNLDSLLLTKDGGFEVYPATELTAEMAMEKGACDVLSFGPLLLKDGKWRHILNTYHASKEPRTALGKMGEDHYLLVFA